MVVPRRNGNIRAQPPSNLPISPVATMAPHAGAAGPVRRTPSTGPRRGSFLARQNAIQTSSGSISHQSESSSHSHSPSPVCTPLPFSESSRTYRGSVPNIVGATRSSPFQPPSASRPNHQHGSPTVSHSQPSLNSSRSRSSSRSPLGGASSSTSDHSAHAPIPRIFAASPEGIAAPWTQSKWFKQSTPASVATKDARWTPDRSFWQRRICQHNVLPSS